VKQLIFSERILRLTVERKDELGCWIVTHYEKGYCFLVSNLAL
jgi:hypothetical protein